MSTKKFVSVIVVAFFLAAMLPVAAATAEVDFYPKAAVVVGINYNNCGEVVVTVEDGEGFLWDIYWDLKEDDVELGDVLALIMWEAGTPDFVLDDEVLDVINEHFKAE